MEKIAQLTIPGKDGPVEVRAPQGVPTGGSGTLASIISVSIQIFLVVVIISSLLYLLWAGIRWVQSSGDPQKIDEARKQIIFALIGLAVALLSFAIIAIFGSVLGINLLQLPA